jgi:hypothetical protein
VFTHVKVCQGEFQDPVLDIQMEAKITIFYYLEITRLVVSQLAPGRSEVMALFMSMM